MKESASQQPKNSVSHTLRRLTQLTKYNHDALFSLPWDPSPGCLSFRAGMGSNGLSGVCRLVHCCFSLFFGCMFKVCSLRTTKPSFPCEPHNNFWKDVPGGGSWTALGLQREKPPRNGCTNCPGPWLRLGAVPSFLPADTHFHRRPVACPTPCASGLGITALRHPCRRRRTRGPFPFCVPRTVFKANSSPSPKPRSPLCPLPEPPCLPQSGSNRSLTGAPETPSPGTSLGPRDQRPGTIRSAPARGRVARSCTDNVGKAGHPRTPAAETEFKSEQRGLFHTEGSAGEDASCPLCFLLRGETSAPEPSLCP